jgi:hypothetical protein
MKENTMNIWRWSSLLVVAPLIGLVGCDQRSTEEQALITQLRASAARIVQTSDLAEWPLSGTEQSLRVNGEMVQVYAYDSAQQANAEAAGISPDGQKMTEGIAGDQTTVTVSSPFHFYKKDRLIVCYDGSQSGVITLLQASLGPPIAGAG